MLRYYRNVIYDREEKNWKSYYKNKNGKVIFDKKTGSKKEVVNNLKNRGARSKKVKNKPVNMKVYTKNETQKNIGKIKAIFTESKTQKKIDRILRKKKLNENDILLLKENIKFYNYKTEDTVKKLQKQFKSFKKPVSKKTGQFTLQNVFTLNANHYKAPVFKPFNRQVNQNIKQSRNKYDTNQYRKFKLNFEIDGTEFEGVTSVNIFESVEQFQKGVSNIIKNNKLENSISPGKRNVTIKWKGIE